MAGATVGSVQVGGCQVSISGDFLDMSAREPLLVDLRERIDELAGVQGELCVVVLDVVDFAAVRDLYGDATADEVADRIGDSICSRTRGTDLVARVEDGVYVVVLTAVSDPGDASFVADKICRQIGEPMTASGHEIHLTVHAGIAIARAGESGNDLIASARRDAQTLSSTAF